MTDPSHALVPVSATPPAQPSGAIALPDIVRRAGQAAVFAAEEFFYGAIRNEHTRIAYRRAVDRFFRVYADGGTFFPGEEWSACKHPVEETRGQVGHGDAYSPGWFDLPLAAEGSAMLVLTAEAADPSPETCHQASTMREAEDRVAVERAGVESHDGLGRQLAIASRAFVVRRGVGKSVIAGYPWFLDWGRDT